MYSNTDPVFYVFSCVCCSNFWIFRSIEDSLMAYVQTYTCIHFFPRVGTLSMLGYSKDYSLNL